MPREIKTIIFKTSLSFSLHQENGLKQWETCKYQYRIRQSITICMMAFKNLIKDRIFFHAMFLTEPQRFHWLNQQETCEY